MRLPGIIKTLTVVLILLALLNYITIQVSANPGAGIDFINPDPALYTVTFYSNDDRIDTTLAQVQVEEGNVIGTAGIPQNPTRSGFNFIGWNTMSGGTGSNVTASTTVNSNLSVFAQWTVILTTPTPTPTPIPTPTPTPPASPQTPTPPTPTPAPALQPLQPPPAGQIPPEAPPQLQLPPEQSEPEPAELEEVDIFELGVPQAPLEVDEIVPPLANIFGGTLLLFALPGINSWALMNLMMSIAGIILVVITITRLLVHKKKDDKKERYKITNSFNEEFENPENNDSSKKFRLIWFAVGSVSALMAVIMFVLTQDMTAIIALADWWTLVHIVILAIVILSCVIVVRGQKNTQNGKVKTVINTNLN